jgi:hypothetical protein
MDQLTRRRGGRVVRSRGPRAHATIVHGCARRHTAEARPPRCPDHAKLAHEWSPRYAWQCSGARGQSSGDAVSATALTGPRAAALPGDMLAPRRRGNALAQRLRLACTDPPPRGTVVSTGAAALCPCSSCLSPLHPLTGALRIADRFWRSVAVPLLPLVLCGLSFLLASICTVMPQGSYVKARPRCWRTAVTDLCVPGDRRRIRVPDAVRARAGGPRGDSVSPPPSRVAALRCRSNGLLLLGCVLPGTRGGSRAPSPDRPPWRREPSLWPALPTGGLDFSARFR